MKLNPEQKFIMPNDDGNLILITEIDFDYSMLQNNIISMKGINVDVDYDNNTILMGKNINIQTSFTIDNIYSDND